MKHPLVIALRGVPDVGKTTTLKMLLEFLQGEYLIEKNEEVNKVIREVVSYKGKKIVIATCGDNQAYMETNIDYFNQYQDADAYVCAVRSRGLTNDLIDDFARSKQTEVIYVDKYGGRDIFESNIQSVYAILKQLQLDIDGDYFRSYIISSEEYVHVDIYAYDDFNLQERSVTVDFTRKEELARFTDTFDYQVHGGEYAPTYVKLENLSEDQKFEEGYYTMYVRCTCRDLIRCKMRENDIDAGEDYAFYINVINEAVKFVKNSKGIPYSFSHSIMYRSWHPCHFYAMMYDYMSLTYNRLVVKKVGNANYNEIWADNRAAIVYDFGAWKVSDAERHKLVTDAKNSYKDHAKPSLIISHWDRDHYNLLHKFDDVEFKSAFRFVVCPNLFYSESAIRAFEMIIKSNVAYVLLPVYAAQYHRPKSSIVPLCAQYPLSNPKLYIGISEEGKAEANSCCIGLTVCGNHGKLAALTGDMNYSSVQEFASDVDYLVVPHHGSYNSIDGSKSAKMLPNVREDALISAANLYGHPHQGTINLFTAKSIKCYCTCTCTATSPLLSYVDADIERDI